MQIAIDNRVFFRKLWSLALPIAFQSLMLAAVAAGDALMLGRVTQDEMTAVSLATQIQFVQNMFLSAATMAGSILGAQYFGKGDRKTISRIFNLMLVFSGAVSVLFFAACEGIPRYLMMAFTHDAPLIGIGAGYLRIAGWSYLLTGVSQCYLAIMKVTDHVRASVLISTGAVVLNVILNALFIFGLFGLPAMRYRGAALATTVARVVELLLAVGLSFGRSRVRPDLRRFFLWDRDLLRDFLRQYWPLLGALLLWGVGFTAYTAVIGHMGSDAAAANSVASVVRDLVCCACNGIGNAAGIMVGNELGAGKLELGRAYGLKLTRISWIIGFSSTALVLAVTPLVLRMVLLTDAARQELTGMMVIMAVYMIGRCVNTVVINGVLDGGGDTTFDLYSLAVAMWGIAVPLAILGAFVFHWPVLAVYACTCLDEVGKIPWVMVRLKKFKWVRDLTQAKAAAPEEP